MEVFSFVPCIVQSNCVFTGELVELYVGEVLAVNINGIYIPLHSYAVYPNNSDLTIIFSFMNYCILSRYLRMFLIGFTQYIGSRKSPLMTRRHCHGCACRPPKIW